MSAKSSSISEKPAVRIKSPSPSVGLAADGHRTKEGEVVRHHQRLVHPICKIVGKQSNRASPGPGMFPSLVISKANGCYANDDSTHLWKCVQCWDDA